MKDIKVLKKFLSTSTSPEDEQDLSSSEPGRNSFYDALERFGDRNVDNYLVDKKWTIFEKKYPTLVPPLPLKHFKKDSIFSLECICGQPCDKTAYMVHNETQVAFCVGQCCMNKANPASLLKKCVTCAVPYRGRYDECVECRKITHKATEEVFRQEQAKIIQSGKYLGQKVDDIVVKDKLWCKYVLEKTFRTHKNRDSLAVLKDKYNDMYQASYISCCMCSKCYTSSVITCDTEQDATKHRCPDCI